MYEISDYINSKKDYSTVIIKCPSGKYIIAGSIPNELTEDYTSGFTVGKKSKVWDSLREVISALLAIGVTRFQMPDCSWFGDGSECDWAE